MFILGLVGLRTALDRAGLVTIDLEIVWGFQLSGAWAFLISTARACLGLMSRVFWGAGLMDGAFFGSFVFLAMGSPGLVIL